MVQQLKTWFTATFQHSQYYEMIWAFNLTELFIPHHPKAKELLLLNLFQGCVWNWIMNRELPLGTQSLCHRNTSFLRNSQLRISHNTPFVPRTNSPPLLGTSMCNIIPWKRVEYSFSVLSVYDFSLFKHRRY